MTFALDKTANIRKECIPMSIRARRRLINEIADEIKRKEVADRLYRSNYCTTCSFGDLKESVISAHSFRVFDPSNSVKYLVGYLIGCKKDLIEPYYDTSYSRKICREGDDNCTQCCATCRYAEPVVVGILHERKSGIARRWQHMPPQNCTVHRTFYRCTNGRRMEHYEKGTVMCTYIRCEYYEKAEGETNVKNKQPH